MTTTKQHKAPLARNLRHLREKRGMTQEGLAAKAGLTRSCIAKLEAGERGAHVETLSLLAKALRTSADALLRA